jgi:predicted TIM-barrel fold metal-dependent hydrolase
VKSDLPQKPSVYMDRNVYASFIRDRVGILNRNLPGGRNIMWSSDYPHSETSYPNSQDTIKALFEGVPEDEKALIVGGRAAKLYGFG